MATEQEITDSVLLVVDSIPAGSVSSYGDIARLVGCGPRLVARILANSGGSVPWWRVVRSDGRIAAPGAIEAAERLRTEGVRVFHNRVNMSGHRAQLD